MKRFICLTKLVFLLSTTSIFAQNQIPNPSFEELTVCPTNQGVYAKYWYSPIKLIGVNSNLFPWGTPDFWHTCVPSNYPYYGGHIFQYNLDGNGVIGLIITGTNLTNPNLHDVREFHASRLTNKLVNGKQYCGSFYANLHNDAGFATESIGMYFYPDSIISFQSPWNQVFNFNSIFHSKVMNKSGIILDTLNWTKVEGSFKATGTEEYVYLGNFEPLGSYNSIATNFQPFGIVDSYAYYLIDKTSLVELTKFPQIISKSYNCAAQTVTLTADTGFNFRWYLLPDTNNVQSTTDTFFVDASSQKNVLLRATLCSTEFTDTLFVPKLDCTGIEDNALVQGASIFPNPASNEVNFSLQGIPPAGTLLQITDLNGKVLHKQNVIGKNTEVDLGTLSNGVYLITYHASNNVIWKEKLCIFH